MSRNRTKFNLEVRLEGVFLLVPDKPFFKKDKKKWTKGHPCRADVLMPDLKVAKPAPWKEDDGHWPVRSEHSCLLIVDEEHLDLGRSDFDFKVVTKSRSGTIETKLVIMLDRQNLVFKLGNSELPAFSPISEVYPVDQKSPKAGQERSLWWLPRLQELSPSFQWADKAFEPKSNQPPNQELAAALRITTGSLEVDGFNLDDNHDKQLWDFGWPRLKWRKKGFRRVIGNQLLWRVNDLTQSISLEAQHDQTFKREWHFNHPGEGKAVSLKLANIELERVLIPNWKHKPRDSDPDFLEHYPLCVRPWWSKSGPVPMIPNPHGPTGPIDDPCSPTATVGYERSSK